VLRKIFGLKRDEVMGGWRKLHNKELQDLYPLPCIIGNIKSRGVRWAGPVARMGEKRNLCRFRVGKSEGKITLVRPRPMWVDNIKMDLVEIGLGELAWIGVAHLESSCELGNEPSDSIKCWETIEWLCSWRAVM
jgi:hypothetical protein